MKRAVALDAETVFFVPKLYIDTASGQKTVKREKCNHLIFCFGIFLFALR